MKRHVGLLACLLLVCATSHADSWALKAEVKDTEFVFGGTRIVLHYDSTKNRSFPDYRLDIYWKGKLVGRHEDIGFERVFASADHAYYLGVSNSGLIPDAYVVFDRNGRILKKQPHDPRKVPYSTVSKTLIRKWYDPEEPHPKFSVVEGKLQDVSINRCDGESVSLLSEE